MLCAVHYAAELKACRFFGASRCVLYPFSLRLLPRCPPRPSSPCLPHRARLHRRPLRLLVLLSREAQVASALAPVVGLAPAFSPSRLQWLATPVPHRISLRLFRIRLLPPLSFPRHAQMCQMHLVPQPLRSCCQTLLLALLLGGLRLLQSLPLAHPSPQFQFPIPPRLSLSLMGWTAF